MKKLFSLGLALVVAIFVFTGCIKFGNSGTSKFDPEQLKTMKDVFAYADSENSNEGYNEKKYVFAFSVDGIYYRAVAELPEDISAEIWKIDFSDEKKDQKVKDLVSPLEAKIENLSDQIPSQDELNKLVGKVGQELFDNGWTYWSYNLVDMEAGMNHGAFNYTVKFEYKGKQMQNTDDFDFYDKFKDLRVSSVKFEGLGDATNLE